MSLEKEDYIARIRGVLQDHAEFLEPDDVHRFLDEAVLLYSKERPQVKVCEITGDGSTYEWKVSSIMSDWIEEFSYIKSQIEYPAATGAATDSQVPQYVDENYYTFYRKLVSTVTTLYLRFTGFLPASGKIARFEYVIPHVLDDSNDTVKDGDANAVVNLTAALCFWALAAKFAQSTEPTIDADSVDYQRKADIYTELAKERTDMYKSVMGLNKTGSKASAGVVVKDLDIKYPGSIGDYLTHPTHIR